LGDFCATLAANLKMILHRATWECGFAGNRIRIPDSFSLFSVLASMHGGPGFILFLFHRTGVRTSLWFGGFMVILWGLLDELVIRALISSPSSCLIMHTGRENDKGTNAPASPWVSLDFLNWHTFLRILTPYVSCIPQSIICASVKLPAETAKRLTKRFRGSGKGVKQQLAEEQMKSQKPKVERSPWLLAANSCA